MVWIPVTDPLPVWQEILDQALEAGLTPTISLGLRTLRPQSMADLRSLSRLSGYRGAGLAPRMAAGGVDAFWLLAMLQWPSHVVAPVDIVLYAGGDMATYAATLNLLASSRELRASRWNVPWLGPGLQWMLAPVTQPSARDLSLENLPFAMDLATFATFLPVSSSRIAWTAKVLPWMALLLAIALVVVALFV